MYRDLAEFHSNTYQKHGESMIRKFGFLQNISYEPFMLSVSDGVKTKKTTLKIGIPLVHQIILNFWGKQMDQSNPVIGDSESDIKVVLYGTKSDFRLSSQILAHNGFNDY